MITRRNSKRGVLAVVAAMVCLTSAACGFFSRPPNQFYALETIAGTGTRVAIGTPPLGVDGVELPPGIDRRGIALRGADHKLEVRGRHQWSASLEDMVTHTLAFNIANRVTEGSVVLPGQVKPSGPMRSLYVIFEDFAAGPDRVLHLDARWTVAQTGAPMITRHERIDVQLDSTDSERIVAAMSQALATLADRIVAGVAAP